MIGPMIADRRPDLRRRGRGPGAVAVVAAAALLLSGCPHATPPPQPPPNARRPPPPLVEHSAEYLKGKEIGRQFVAAALREYRFDTDWEVAGAVSQVGRRLVAGIGADPDTYHFFVVRNPQANAFAIPGGYIFVFDGLLTRLQSEEELAGVLAHEIGHVRRGHFFKNQKQLVAADLAVLAAILLGQGGGAVTAFSLAGAASLQLSYSRENEREADQSALATLPAAGYDPGGLARFFGVLYREEHLLLPENQFPYLATHPGLDERYRWAQRTVEQSGVAPLAPRPPELWDRLAGTLAADDIARRPPTGGPYREGLAYLKASRFQEARPLLEQATKEGRDGADAWAALGECRLAMGEPDGAREAAEKAMAVDPGDPLGHLLAGEIAWRARNKKAALVALRQAVLLAPDHPMAHFRLSEVLDATGRTDEARYHLARFLRLTLHPAEAYATLRAIPATADPDLNALVDRELRGLQAEGI
jgi:predicted Zn-dependent protease